MGNLTAGVDLIRRIHGVHVHAMTVPLITSASGAKFGKSEGNALYLDPELTTPYELYQYWINTDDRDVGRYLRIFTFLPLDEIAEVERAQTENPASRSGQRLLAFEITRLIHGEQVAGEVASAFWVPLRSLHDGGLWRDTEVTGKGFRMTRRAFHHEGHVIWGITERIIAQLLSLLEGGAGV